MKTKNTRLIKLSLFAAVIGFTAMFSSCSDDDVEDGSSLNVKIVNAAEASGSQDFYIEGTKVSTVAEASSTNYIATASSGNNRKVEFRTTGSADVYASKSVDLKDNKNYSFILSGTGNSATITATEDDLSAPSSGKAKVRFVHLTTAANVNGNVDLSVGAVGSEIKLASNVAYGNTTNFFEVDPGVKLLHVYAAGSTSNSVDLALSNLEAGKIYTIILRGSTTASVMLVSNN